VRRFVVDSSVALSWCFSDEADAYAEATLQALRSAEARAPSLWPFEVANGLWMGQRRGRLDATETQEALSALAVLPIQVEAATHQRALGAVLNLASQEGLTVYDATYLDLAQRERLPLATLDQQIRQVAARLGVVLFDPS
jgi:predicted nucleic acid-binding protein